MWLLSLISLLLIALCATIGGFLIEIISFGFKFQKIEIQPLLKNIKLHYLLG